MASGQSRDKKCGFIAIVGRPNVGKSTLLNHLIQQKISITSRKPQTTRQNIIGIKTDGDRQFVFVDTPGIHIGQKKTINRFMNNAASSAMRGVDVIIFVVDRDHWTEEDETVFRQIEQESIALIVVVNKVDQMPSRDAILPHLVFLQSKLSKIDIEADIVPLSALKNQNLDRLESLLSTLLPSGTFHFPQDQVTDRSMRFMAAEAVREKITRQMGAELPYQIAVEIEEFDEQPGLITIGAVILAEREGQKRMLIGDKGEKMKSIGKQARLDMENLFSCKVMLNLWVKVKSGWSDSERALKSLGFDEK